MTNATAAPARLLNAVTGETADIERSALAGDHGGGTTILFTLPAGAAGAPPHFHARYRETFRVIRGTLEVRHGRALPARTLQAGDAITVRPGDHHAFRNASTTQPVVFRVEVDRGDGFERFVRAWYGLGAPRHPLHVAIALDAGDINLVGLPAALQRVVRRALVRLAALTGAYAEVARHWSRDRA